MGAIPTTACAHHTRGITEADRLDLARAGITLDPQRLCTAAARQPTILLWAIWRGQKNAEQVGTTHAASGIGEEER